MSEPAPNNPTPNDPPPSDPTPVDPTPPADPAPPNDPPPSADPSPSASADPAPAEPSGLDENWRRKAAGENGKMAKWLGRYSTVEDALSAGFEAQATLRSTRSNVLPDDPSEEQLAEWRAENGIPAKPEEYQLADGLVVGEADKPVLDAVLAAMHKENATPGQVNAAVNAYYEAKKQEIADVEIRDTGDKNDITQTLRDEWGPDFHSNKNAVHSLINQFPEDSRELLMNARLSDGMALMNHPGIVMTLADLSRKTNPAATVVPNANDPVTAISDELASIRKTMRDNPQEYWKDDRMQARHRELLGAEENMNG